MLSDGLVNRDHVERNERFLFRLLHLAQRDGKHRD